MLRCVISREVVKYVGLILSTLSYPPIADMKGQDIVVLMITATLHLLLVIVTVGGEISMSALYRVLSFRFF
jgi:hypothetical protein